MSIVAFFLAETADFARVVSVLEFRADWRTKDMEGKIQDAADNALVTAAYITSVDNVNDIALERFVRRVRQGNDPSVSIAWAPQVRRDEREAFEAMMRARGTPDFRITDQGTDGTLVPAGERDVYFPVMVNVRFDDRNRPIGFDTLSTEIRRKSGMLARDRGTPVSAEPTPLVNASELTPAFRIYSPVYFGEIMPETIEERRAKLRGLVVGIIEIQKILTEAIDRTPAVAETYTFFMGSGVDSVAPASGSEAIAVYSPNIGKIVGGPVTLSPPEAGGLRLTRSFEVLGQRWTLVHDSSQATVSELRSSAPFAWLVAGLTLTLLTTVYLLRERMRMAGLATMVEERTAELSSVVLAAPFALITLDEKGRVLSWNRAAERIFGYAASEVIGHPFPTRTVEETASLMDTIARVKSGELDIGRRVRRPRKDGEYRDLILSCVPISRGDTFTSLAVAIEDVTDRLQLEDQLRHAQKMEALGRLTGGIAHDFNNLLAVVLNASNVLTSRLDGQQHELAEMCQQAARRGKALTSRMMSYARQQSLRPEQIDVAAKVTSMLTILHRTLGEDIEIKPRIAATIPPALADAGQLESAILNLAVNSKDAMENGGTLTVEVAPAFLDEAYCAANADANPGHYVMLAIGDTGTGMEAEVAARAFDPFFTTKDIGKGTGLGLSMVYGFVKQSNGHVKIDSEPGRGTAVRLYLPVAGGSKPAAAIETATNGKTPSTGSEAILVVEDDELLRKSVVTQIKSLGYTVAEAEDGPTALARLAERPFDLIFSDVVMPGGVSGVDLARQIAVAKPGIKILLTSGYTERSMLFGHRLPAGIRFLSKPCELKELAEGIRAALENRN